jgi:hypothetical protein
MTDNITLPRAVVERMRGALKSVHGAVTETDWEYDFHGEIATLDAALAEPEPDAIAQAVEAEREACAKVCEQPSDEIQITDDISQRIYKDAFDCAEAIRARGSK